MAIIEELGVLRESTLDAIAQAADTTALDAVRVGVVGKSGTLTAYLRNMGQIPKEERAQVGKTVNAVRDEVESALEARKAELSRETAETKIRLSLDLDGSGTCEMSTGCSAGRTTPTGGCAPWGTRWGW